MRPRRNYAPVDSGPGLKGLATSVPSNKLDPRFSPRLMNVVVRDGVVYRRAGGHQLGRRLVGSVLGITEFGEIGEDPWFVVLTSHRQYAYDPGAEDYVDLTPGLTSYNITAVNQGLKQFTIAGDHTADFPADRLIPVEGGANEGVYTVVSATFSGGNTLIVVVETIPSSSVSGAITVADDFTTQERDFLSFVGVTDLSGHRFLVTNGRDTPRVWDGDIGSPFADWTPTYTDFVTCKVFAVFNEHLFMGNVETTTNEPQLIAWSDAGDFDEFEAGDAGVQLLYQLNSEILALHTLGDRLVIYSHDSIMTGVFIGGQAVFAFEVIIPEGTRLVSPKAIASINVGHIFASEENFYLFDGTRGLRVLSDAIYNDYKGRKDEEFIHRASLFNDFTKRTLYLAIPDIETGKASIYTMFYDVFNLGDLAWAKERYHDDVRSWGYFINREELLTWEDASWEPANMAWEDELGAWAEQGEQIDFPIRAYGTPEGRVVIVTEGAVADRGVVPEQSYETKDFEIPEAVGSLLGRWGEIEFEGWGNQVNVLYSVNGGGSFVGAETVVLTAARQAYRVPLDAHGRTIRVKFITTGSVFGLSWIRLWVTDGGPR